jgi:hypothetical protein
VRVKNRFYIIINVVKSIPE